MRIRICNANDKEEWVKMNREFKASGVQDDDFWSGGQEASEEKFAATFDLIQARPETAVLLIAEDDEGRTIGFANLKSILSVWTHGKVLFLDDLYFKAGCQGRGNRTQMLKYIEDYAQANGYKGLQFLAEERRETGDDSYARLGYAAKDMKLYVKHF